MSDGVSIKIECCNKCPHWHKERNYTADSFEHEYKWMCKESDNKIIAYMDWNDTDPSIPSWCPLKEQVEEKNTEELPIPQMLENPELSELKGTLQNFIDFVASDEYHDDNDYEYWIADAAVRTFFGENVYTDYINKRGE